MNGAKMSEEKKEKALMAEAQPPLAITPPAAVTNEVLGVDEAVSQVKSLVPSDASPGLLIGGAALLAVIGAAIKFGPGMMKASSEKAARQHELDLERLRLEREKSEKQDDSHKECALARAALEAKVAGLQARLDDMASKSQGFDFGDIDFDSIQERLKKIEKVVAPPKKRGRPRKDSQT
jgi:hypothetical protein